MAALNGIVENMMIDNYTVSGPAANSGRFVVEQAGGWIKNLILGDGVLFGSSGVTYDTSNASARNLMFGNITASSFTSLVSGSGTGTFNVFIGSVIASSIGNNVLQHGFFSGQTVRYVVQNISATAGKHVLLGGAGTISINGPQVRADFGVDTAAMQANLAGSVVGDQVFNTNATFTPGVYGRNTSPAWAKVF